MNPPAPQDGRPHPRAAWSHARTALLVGHNDLRLFLRNRASYIWLFVIPMAFVYFMAFANRGPGDPRQPRPAVLVDDRDEGFLGGVFREELGSQGLAVVAPTNSASATRGIVIPARFTADVLAGRQGRVQFFAVGGAALDPASALVQARIVRALIAVNSHLIEHAAARGPQPPDAASLAALAAREDPVRTVARFAGRKPIPTGFNLSLPGVLVMYLMMNLLVFGGTSLAAERRGGVLRRMATSPVSRGALIAGKVYGLLLLAAVQILVLLLAGRYLLGVNLGEHLGAVLLTLLVYAWVAASLGVLIGSWVRQEERVVGLCVMLTISMAALGGCWWPLEVVPDSMRFLAYLFPAGWAMDALHQSITYGNGLAGAREELGVLLLFGAGANLGAARAFRV